MAKIALSNPMIQRLDGLKQALQAVNPSIVIGQNALVFGGALRDDILKHQFDMEDIQTNDFDVIYWSGSRHQTDIKFPESWGQTTPGDGFIRRTFPSERDVTFSEFQREGMQCKSLGYLKIPNVKWPVNLLKVAYVLDLSRATLVKNADLSICAIAWDGSSLTVGENFLRDIQAKQVCLQNPAMFGGSNESYARTYQRAIGFAKRFGFENKVSAVPPWHTTKPQGSGRYLFSDYD